MKAYRLTTKQLLKLHKVRLDPPKKVSPSHFKRPVLDPFPGTELTIHIPHPPNEVRPNFHPHWAVKGRKVKELRALSAALIRCALSTMEGDRVTHRYGGPMWERATVSINWRTWRAWAPDPDNVVGSMKAIFDGAQDAELIANDKGLFPEMPVISTLQPDRAEEVVLVFKKQNDENKRTEESMS